MAEPAALRATARRLRRLSLLSTSEAGSGHPTTCLSAADIAAVLFFHVLRFDPKDPQARNVDAFVLSKGHAAPLLWAALHEAGAIDQDPLSLRRFTSPLEGHPTPLVPWVKVATGSLGQGLNAACGMALGKRLDGLDGRVYCLLGDGETAEGSVWEAASFAAHHGLANVCAIVDVNGLGQSGPPLFGHDTGPYAARFQACGFTTVEVDGHDVEALMAAFEVAAGTRDAPTAIIARTEKGKGVPAVEGKPGWHGKPLKKGKELEEALAALGPDEPGVGRVEPRRLGPEPAPAAPVDPSHGDLRPAYELGQEVATREAYGTALVKLGKVSRAVCALDGDTKNSTFSERFKDAHEDRFFECYIAEQGMVGAALGLAAEDKVPFASTFACFFTRAYDFIRMGVISRPKHLVLCGSHAGVSIGEDGASQMGLEDLAMMRALVASTVLYPSDAVSAERLTFEAAATPGIVYIRTSRPKTKVIYGNDERFPVGGSKTPRSSANDVATVVAAGVTVFEALAAADQLDVPIRVIDAYSVKPLDVATLRRAASETRRLIVVEDHSAFGGLGEAVAAAVGDRAPVEILAVRDIPRSGTPREMLEHHGISARAIVAAVRRSLVSASAG